MKGLSVLIAALAIGFVVTAGPIELTLGAGPSATPLPEFNTAIGVINTWITYLNEAFDVHPDITGAIDPVDPIGTELCLQASEQYWPLDWLAIGGRLEYASTETGTSGQYMASDTSDVSVDLAFGRVSVLGTVRTIFLDAGLRLGLDLAGGYFYSFLDRDVTFEIPVEYTDAISGLPAEGSARYSGGAFGFEAGLVLDIPIADWFVVGSLVKYRVARIETLKSADGTSLDIDSDGAVDSVTLDGVSVAFTVSIRFDLSPDGGKE